MKPTEMQQKAIDSRGNVIVSAGAGSGKTAVLTARAIDLITKGIHVNELLVLTFTNAAAAEMKARIRKELKKIPELKSELSLIDEAYITTFDSFSLSIIKRYNYLLNIPKNISPAESSIINLQKPKIMEEIFNEYYEQDNSKFNQLIDEHCFKSDTKLKSLIISIANEIDKLPNKEEYLNNYIDNYYSDNFINHIIDTYTESLFMDIESIRTLSEDLSYLIPSELNQKTEEALLSLFGAKTFKDIYERAPITTLPRYTGLDDDAKKVKENLSKALNGLKSKIELYGNEETIKKDILSTKNDIEIILEIVKKFITKLNEYKKQNDLYTFQDIAFLALDLLSSNEEVRNEIASEFKEIMIDEYQDTNDIQETFISYISHDNVFVVGDIKQSIYRFRNANPDIFRNKYEKYSNKDDGEKIDLMENFRSRIEVNNCINDIFGYLMDTKLGGASYHNGHEMIHGNHDYDTNGSSSSDYNYEVLEYNEEELKDYIKEEKEAFIVAKDIKEKINNHYQVFEDGSLRDCTYKDFAIIVDRNTNLDLYKQILVHEGIPVDIKKSDKLSNSYELNIIRNIIDLIINMNEVEDLKDNIDFKYDFISISRSYLFQIDDNKIFNYLKNNNYEESELYKLFKPLKDNLVNYNAITLLNEIIKVTDLYNKMIKVGSIKENIIRISKIKDIATHLSLSGYDIYSLRDYLTELISSEETLDYKSPLSGSNSIIITNIHQSKGLQYHVCYFIGLSNQFASKDTSGELIYSKNFGIIAAMYNNGLKDTVQKIANKYSYMQEEISEKIRLFYVALTRAQEKIIIVLPECEAKKSPLNEDGVVSDAIRNNYKSLRDMMNSIKYFISNAYHKIDLSEINLNKDYLINNEEKKHIDTTGSTSFTVTNLTPEKVEIEESAHFSKNLHELISMSTRDNLKLGLKLHEALELTDFMNPDLNLIEDEFIRNKVNAFLHNDILKDLSNANIYKEHEFIYEKDNMLYHGIIDLMIEYNDHIDIIDYKTENIDDENYQKQLQGYKDYVSTLTDKKINTYLYSILREEVKQV